MLVGIDLGTTNSLIGCWTEAGPRLTPNALGEYLTPSAVALSERDEILVGASALEMAIASPTRAATSFKRNMGTLHEYVLGKRRFRPEELSALVLRALADDFEAATGNAVREAVISVPAYFSDAQRKATRTAGELAGFRVERLINEPTAAALAYGLQDRHRESRFLVLDLGGGTFDVSVLETFEGVFEVHASAGDNFLGGNDFDELLCLAACKDLGVAQDRISQVEHSRARARVERLKRQLSLQKEAPITLTLGGEERSWSVSEERFESISAPLLERMRAPIERALRDARILPAQLEEIVLVGGASRMPMVSRLVTRLFGRLPLRHIHPDQTVALGTAVMAGLKSRAAEVREIVLTDVCPYTLGVEVARVEESGRISEGLFSPVIERNMVVPVSRVERYSPIRDFQPSLILKVYQGESPRVASNVCLGQLEIRLPPAPRNQVAVDVRFTYEVNGLLEVEATVQPAGQSHRLVIERNPGLMSPAEISERLRALGELKIHPREHQANLAVLRRAERLYAERLGEERRVLGEWLAEFNIELESQDPARIERARRRLHEHMNEIDRGLLPS